MVIDNKFIYFKTQEAFREQNNQRRVDPQSIVFIGDKGVIWTHNKYFGSSTGFEKAKGYFDTINDLRKQIPTPEIGDWAILGHAVVGDEYLAWVIATCEVAGKWKLTSNTYDRESYDMSEYLKKGDVDLTKYVLTTQLQWYLTKAEASKFITNDQLLSIENEISSIRKNVYNIDNSLSLTSTNPVQNKTITEELNTKANTQDVEDALNEKADKSELAEYAKTTYVKQIVNESFTEVQKQAERSKGYFDTLEQLIAAVPNPEVGDWAVINVDGTWSICRCITAGVWTVTDQKFENKVDLSEYAKLSDLATLQDICESNDNAIVSKINEIQEALDKFKKKYISWLADDDNEGSSGTLNLTRTIITSQQKYNALDTYEKDAIYFVVDGYEEDWKFGDSFPITFTDKKWALNDAFPIILD